MKKKTIYTFRPYYIDTERLYDMYSTVMDGYSDTEEAVEIIRNNAQNSKKGTGTVEFSITSLFNKGIDENNRIGLSGSVSGGTGMEWSRVNENEREYQKKSTRKLSPCVLLNWMLDRMVNDKRILETTTRWLHRPIIFSSDALGFPVILEGCIKANSAKVLTRLNVYPRGIRSVFRRITEFFSSNGYEKGNRKRKYILLTKQDHGVGCILQQVRIDLALLKDMLPDSIGVLSEIGGEYYSKIQALIMQLELVTRASFLETVEMMIIEKENNRLSSVIKAIDLVVNEYNEDSALSVEFSSCVNQIKQIQKTIKDYQTRIKGEIYEGKNSAYGYVFDLKETMYYSASEEDILNSPSIKCLGLIKGIGMKMYELEIVALYQ